MSHRLIEPWFEARFYGFISADGSHWNVHPETKQPIALADAQGLELWCPCGIDARDENGELNYPLDLSLNKGRPHGVMIPFANPPSGIPCPPDHGPFSRDGQSHPRWTVSGSGLDDLTLTPSVAVGPADKECWHGFITAGEIR